MAAPSGDIEICNMALDVIGQPSITSIDPPTSVNEKIVARHYDAIRQDLLRNYPWHFAKKRAVITRTGTPDFDFRDMYLMPIDCLRIISIDGESEGLAITKYDIEGRNILINADIQGDPANPGPPSIKLRYIADVLDVGQWDAQFKNLMSLRLAERIVYQITKSVDIWKMVAARIKQESPDAVSINGQERPPIRVEKSKAINARRFGTSTQSIEDIFTIVE